MKISYLISALVLSVFMFGSTAKASGLISIWDGLNMWNNLSESVRQSTREATLKAISEGVQRNRPVGNVEKSSSREPNRSLSRDSASRR